MDEIDHMLLDECPFIEHRVQGHGHGSRVSVPYVETRRIMVL